MIEQARALAIAAHDSIGHVRKYSGDPYWTHPERVAALLAAHAQPDEAVSAGWLHDVLEDVAPQRPEFGEAAILAACGPAVLALVREVTDVSRPGDGNREHRKALDRAHCASASALGQAVKLADLIDNTRDISAHDPDFARTYLREKRLLLDVLTLGPATLMAEAWEAVAQAEFLIRGIR